MDNVNIPNPPQVQPNNYMLFAILTTLFCFIPTGIVALIYASRVDSLWFGQNYGEAYEASRKAKNWCVITACIGALFIIVGIIMWGTMMKVLADTAGLH